MTSRDFCFWLQGFLEISAGGATPDAPMTPAQTDCIQRHLALVFKHEIDRDFYASQLLDAEGRRLSTACDLVQDTLEAHAVMAISSLSEDEWLLELEHDPSEGGIGKQFSGSSLFEAIRAMQSASEKGGDDV